IDADIEVIQVLEESNEGLWHKESLYNLAANLYPLTKNFLFIDSDTYPENIQQWCCQVEEAIDSKYDAFQLYSKISSESANYDQYSYLYAHLVLKQESYAHGLAWGISHEFLRHIDY